MLSLLEQQAARRAMDFGNDMINKNNIRRVRGRKTQVNFPLQES